MAIEDRRFYDHFGLDLRGIARAVYVNSSRGELVQGGSTITQQVAKNLFLTPERSLHRKGQEMLLALWLERNFSKDEILELYPQPRLFRRRHLRRRRRRANISAARRATSRSSNPPCWPGC